MKLPPVQQGVSCRRHSVGLLHALYPAVSAWPGKPRSWPRGVAPHGARSTPAVGQTQRVVRAAAVAVIAPVCFSQACQAATDKAFIIAISIPIITALASVAYLLRPVPKELQDRTFSDPRTGSVFELAPGVLPERDKDGELAFRALSYTPWPVPEDAPGTRLRIPVGPTADCQLRTFVFEQQLPGRSEQVMVTLPRPLGVVFEYDQRLKRAVVVGCVEGSNADQRRRQAALDRSAAAAAPLEGDVLRAVTCTNMVYPTKALFGAVPPERHIVLYGADKQKWAAVRTALRKGESRDGDVTLVLERRVDGSRAANAAQSTTAAGPS